MQQTRSTPRLQGAHPCASSSTLWRSHAVTPRMPCLPRRAACPLVTVDRSRKGVPRAGTGAGPKRVTCGRFDGLHSGPTVPSVAYSGKTRGDLQAQACTPEQGRLLRGWASGPLSEQWLLRRRLAQVVGGAGAFTRCGGSSGEPVLGSFLLSTWHLPQTLALTAYCPKPQTSVVPVTPLIKSCSWTPSPGPRTGSLGPAPLHQLNCFLPNSFSYR